MTGATTTISVLNDQWERATAVYVSLCDAESQLGDEKQAEKYRQAFGSRLASAEADSLQDALLYQVPTNNHDALILLTHVANKLDAGLNWDTPSYHATEAAVEALLSFHVEQCEEPLSGDTAKLVTFARERVRGRTTLASDGEEA